MKYLMSLEKVKQIGEENFFRNQLESFWYDYQKSDEGRDKEKWDGRDSFKIYYSHRDILDPSKMSYFEISLSENLKKHIQGRFTGLETELLKLQIEDKKKAKSHILKVITELDEVGKKIPNLNLPRDYRSVIAVSFNLEMKLLRKKNIFYSKIEKKRKTWKFLYRPEIEIESQRFEDDGRFKDFFSRLKEEKYIDGKSNIIHLKQLFSDQIPTQKIEWLEGPGELYSMIKILIDQEYVYAYREWSAMRDSLNMKFPVKNLHSATPVTNMKKLAFINEIVDELKI
jgi:hypothetical protein